MITDAPPAMAVPEADVVLRDGSTLHVRPATPEDEPRLRAFLASLSQESRWFRYFSAGVNLDRMAHHAATPDGLSLIAVHGPDDTVVGHGMYVDAWRPEVAFAVADAWQGHGIATILLAHLAHAASRAGIETFRATVLPENRRMLQVFQDSGFPASMRRVDDCMEIEFPTSLSREARERFEERQRAADVAAVAHVLRPASVAVIGASRREGTVGNAVVRNLIAAGYAGPLHLVNAKGGEVAGRPTVRSIADVDEDVELAIIAVPAAAVVETARQCAEKGVCALVVLTAGFAEVGAEGRARQDELLTVCRGAGMRMVGPNCLGVANLHHEGAFNATFAPGEATPGGVAFASQSGAFGIAAIDEAAARGIGLSSFVSMGDKADLSGNDFLEYWEQDPDTAVLLLYLESFGNPRRFGRIARRITRRQTGRGGQERPHGGRPARRLVAHRRAARGLRRDRRRAVRSRRRAACRDGGGDVRRRRGARPPAAAARRPRGRAHQRGRPRDPVRRRVRGRRPAHPASVRGDPGAPGRGAPAGGVDRQPGRHDRLRDRRPVRALAADPARG